MSEREFDEKKLEEQLLAIVDKGQVFPGDTISHALANRLVELGWCERNGRGNFVATPAGIALAEKLRANPVKPKKTLQETLIEHLNEVDVDTSCPLCGDHLFSIDPIEFATLARGQDAKAIPLSQKNGAFAAVALTCMRCFHVRLFSFKQLAIKLSTVMGNVSPSPQPDGGGVKSDQGCGDGGVYSPCCGD